MGHFGAFSLIPAIVTILVALIWRRVSLAMFCGIAAGAAVFGGFKFTPVLGTLSACLFAAFRDSGRMKIIVFILLMGGLLEILAAGGAYQAFAKALGKLLRDGRRTRLAIWGLSLCLFFDDYANVLISGSSMRVVARRNGVRPAMLAYLVDVVAVFASVVLVSTWAVFESSTMAESAREVGLPCSMTGMFLASLPYHFYTYLAILLTFLVALSGRWFGARWDTHHFLAMEDPVVPNARVHHALAPLLTLVLGAVFGLFVSGFWILHRRGQSWSLLRILWAAPAVDVLIVATLLALGLAIFLFQKDGVLTRRSVRPAFSRGVRDMLEIALILALAAGLSKISVNLGTGAYLANHVTHALRPEWIPLSVYTLAMLVTVFTGFSWGAMAIVMPVAFSLAVGFESHSMIPILSAAVVTGAVSGEHLIPYSEKAVLSATACGIPPLYHFRTQMAQSLLAFGSAGAGFLLIGFEMPLWVAYGVPILVMVLIHFLWSRPSCEPSGA